jgi:phosphohistidine swiveling domain-containing protein
VSEVERVGGKAASLLELQRAGFKVPETHVSPADLPAVVAKLGFPIAVRSSATLEDGREASFAGQFESYLPLRTLAEVQEAVEKCRASLRAPSVAEYCKKHGIDATNMRMEVIVQRCLEPELAGVAFTVNPVTGAEEVVIEAVEGLAPDLLAGKAPSLPRSHPLVARHAPAIETVARAVQRHYGAPQDVEFGVEKGEVLLLQARPITRIAFPPEVGEWTNADFRDGGVSSGVCTPLMWSLYDYIFQPSFNEFFRDLKLLRPSEPDFQAGRVFFGRPYWNLAQVKTLLARLPGFVERDFDEDLSVEVTYDGPGVTTPATLWNVIKAIPIGLAIERFFEEQAAFARRFIGDGPDGYLALEREHERLPAKADLEAGFRKLMACGFWITERGYFRTVWISSIVKLDFTDAFPGLDYPALASALPPMEHLAPTRALREMAKKGETDIAPLLARYRHHSRRELDLRVPRWDEDPEFVRTLLSQYKDGSAGEDPRPRYEEARAKARAAQPWHKRAKFDRKLDRLRDFLWLREEMRDRSMRMYWLIRRYVLALAEAKGLGDDAFFMTWEELAAGDRSNVARNREVYDSYRSFAAPNEISSRFRAREAATITGNALRGIGASQGVAQGVARVARTVEEAVRVEKGAILICPFTDPGWTAVLDRVAGVVTETGGLLSHAAVICREYGIPAVLGVRDATRLVKDGQQVRLRGGEGLVELC